MLAIVGGKGGCGKTTTALGLARALADAGHSPLVVDADCDMPNLHTMAETDLTPGVGAVAGGAALDRVVHRSRAFPGVDVVPAGRATAPLATETLSRLARARRRVIVDCPAGATEAVARPVRAGDGSLVVSTPDRPSLVDAEKTARMARSLGADVHGVVLTRVRGGRGTHHERSVLDTDCEVVATVPEVERANGQVLDDPMGRSAYKRVARRLWERNC